jgi:hypothetical protein
LTEIKQSNEKLMKSSVGVNERQKYPKLKIDGSSQNLKMEKTAQRYFSLAILNDVLRKH